MRQLVENLFLNFHACRICSCLIICFRMQAMDAPKKFSTREFWRTMRAVAVELGVRQDIG